MIYKEVRVLIYMVDVSRSLTFRIGNEATVFLYGSVFLVTHTQSHRKVHEVTLTAIDATTYHQNPVHTHLSGSNNGPVRWNEFTE